MKKLCGLLFLTLVVLVLPLSAAGQQEPAGGPTPKIEAVDSLGRTVILEKSPERVAAVGKATMIVADALYLFPAMHERVVALGKTNQGLGDFFSLIAPEFPAAERTDHSAGPEEIASRSPDLVLMKSYMYQGLGTQIEQLGIPVFTVDLESPGQYLTEITELGKLFDKSARAQEVTDYFTAELEDIRSRVARADGEEEDILLLYASSRDGAQSFQTSPGDWIQTFIAREAGAVPVWEENQYTDSWQQVSFEQIAAWDPDRIYIISYRSPAVDFLELIEQSPAWGNLSAYRSGKIRAFPADFHNWAQPDTRWILGLRWLAADLHPEEFADSPIEEKIREFYTRLYGIEDKQQLGEIINRYERSVRGN